MQTRGIRVQVSSDVDFEGLIAELYYCDVCVGILSNEPGEGFNFLLVAEPNSVKIPLEVLQHGLQLAKDELLR